MKTIARQLKEAFAGGIREAFGIEADPLVGPSQTDKFGDYQSNAAMGLAKVLSEKTGEKIAPRAVAEQIRARLKLGAMAEEVTIAGPGFINVRLSAGWIADQLLSVATDRRLGIEPVEDAQTVVIDYSGPNVAKEMHVGHLRSTIIGDAISRVIEFQGHRVIRQNHIGDWGTQFGMLIAYLQSGAAGPTTEAGPQIHDLDAFYKAAAKRFEAEPAFQDESRRTVVRLQAGHGEELALWKQIVEATRRHYQPLYERLDVRLTSADERGESFYNPMLPGVVGELKEAGIAVESGGAVVAFTPPLEAPLIVRKSDGGYLYGTTDLAAIRYRVGTLHAGRIIYLTDSRQSQHFTQVFEVAKKAGWAGKASLEHASFGTMLGPDGKPFKGRKGESVKLKDLIDEADERALLVVTEKSPDLPEAQRRRIASAIGIGGVKYADLSKDRVSDYLFSWEKMLELTGNTGPYLQYAFARIASIFRRGEIAAERAASAQMILESPFELALAKQILRLGEVIEVVSTELKPHHLCAYCYELASRFSAFFDNCPVLKSEEPTRSSRLALCAATARALAISLELLGIAHPDQM